MCQCDDVFTVDEACPAACQAELKQVTFNSEGKVDVFDPVTNTTVSQDTLPGTLGSLKCGLKDSSECRLSTLNKNKLNGDFVANFSIPTDFVDSETESEDTATVITQNELFSARFKGEAFHISGRKLDDVRNLQSINTDDQVYNYIANPVICMQRGSAMLFENLDALTYPVYDKDSLLNTNEMFDYGEFLKLPELLADGNFTRFVYTFE